jgi:8-oxo-dGTP pyrophosphatase MutT (NUDIX family)
MEVQWRRAAAYVVCRDDANRLLLTRFLSPGHPDTGKWTMPGGAMEWGESSVETAVRELMEETGLSATIGPVLGVFSRWYTERESVRGEAGHVVGIIHGTSDLAGRIRVNFDETGTTDGAGWFTVDEIHSLPRVELLDFVLGLIADAA